MRGDTYRLGIKIFRGFGSVVGNSENLLVCITFPNKKGTKFDLVKLISYKRSLSLVQSKFNHSISESQKVKKNRQKNHFKKLSSTNQHKKGFQVRKEQRQ